MEQKGLQKGRNPFRNDSPRYKNVASIVLLFVLLYPRNSNNTYLSKQKLNFSSITIHIVSKVYCTLLNVLTTTSPSSKSLSFSVSLETTSSPSDISSSSS